MYFYNPHMWTPTTGNPPVSDVIQSSSTPGFQRTLSNLPYHHPHHPAAHHAAAAAAAAAYSHVADSQVNYRMPIEPVPWATGHHVISGSTVASSVPKSSPTSYSHHAPSPNHPTPGGNSNALQALLNQYQPWNNHSSHGNPVVSRSHSTSPEKKPTFSHGLLSLSG